jgi:hypothetical protein
MWGRLSRQQSELEASIVLAWRTGVIHLMWVVSRAGRRPSRKDSTTAMSRRILRTSIIGVMLAVSTWLPASAYAQPHPQAVRSAPAAQFSILQPPGPWYGRTYNRWSAAWWQYVFAQPASVNPLNDSTGANCAVGQSGAVFFLVGTLGGGSAERNCTVPAGKALFFPLVNQFALHVRCTPQTEQAPGLCDQDNSPQLVWNDLLVPAFNYAAATTLHATIDEVQVGNLGDPATTPYRACVGPFTPCSPASFSSTFPTDNLFSSQGLPAGTYAPSVADGFYLLLAPLTPGMHTINFGGTANNTAGNNPSTQDITYHLTVSAP